MADGTESALFIPRLELPFAPSIGISIHLGDRCDPVEITQVAVVTPNAGSEDHPNLILWATVKADNAIDLLRLNCLLLDEHPDIRLEDYTLADGALYADRVAAILAVLGDAKDEVGSAQEYFAKALHHDILDVTLAARDPAAALLKLWAEALS